MRAIWVVGMLGLLVSAMAGGQQRTVEHAPAEPIYKIGQDVTAPQLLPWTTTLNGPKLCGERVDGNVRLVLDVDGAGEPQNIMFLEPLGNDLDRFALQIAEADRFNPGMHNGDPVTVAVSLEVSIKSCVVEGTDSAGNKTESLKMRSLPEQKVGEWRELQGKMQAKELGHGFSSPLPLNDVAAQYTGQAGQAHIQGKCLVSLVVDEHGMPKDLRVVKGLDPGLDQNALYAANQYRFRPAIKNGKAVPLMITVEINFQLR